VAADPTQPMTVPPKRIFDALPGIEAPVGEIASSLAGMWSDAAEQGRPAPAEEDSTATQVNFVLHLGLNAGAEDAVAQFGTVVAFSRRYPCRVVVLCPLHDDDPDTQMRCKVYGECTIGKTRDDARCCEFVMLSYPRSLRQYLESQVSVFLSTDLPLYYWAHGFATNSGLADYRFFLTNSKRVLIDSSEAPAGAMAYPWPRPEAMRDLVAARLLPVRQGIGQFLSRYPTDVLSGGLRAVSVEHGAGLAPEGRVLMEWLGDRLGACPAAFGCVPAPDAAARTLSVSFAYDGAKAFTWCGDLAAGRALFKANFGSGATTLPASVSLLSPENALSEAMFF
jgi:hypothetical protein